jgi:hypothetical protein
MVEELRRRNYAESTVIISAVNKKPPAQAAHLVLPTETCQGYMAGALLGLAAAGALGCAQWHAGIRAHARRKPGTLHEVGHDGIAERVLYALIARLRIAAALVTREAMGARRNAQFLKFLEGVGQEGIAQLYRDVINPDEERHHQAGCSLLARLAATPEAQQQARRAAQLLLETGDRVRDVLLQKGAPVVPGC